MRKCWFLGLISLAVLLGAGVPLTATTRFTPSASPLRLDEPLEDVIADLDAFVPAYMEAQGVPGVAIALVREGRVAWTGEYGLANRLSRRPIAPDTTFSVASNSKVVTAYIALRLVDQGLLSLDAPLDGYLSEPWLPQEEFRPAITPRHTLSHTSGLGHLTFSRELQFPPGAGYFYSGRGLEYTQEVLEEATGRSLEKLGQELVFQPLGMDHTSFVGTPAVQAQAARGHLPAVVPVLIFVIPFLIALLVLGLVALVWAHVRTGRWRPSRRAALTVYLAAAALASIPTFLLEGGFSLDRLLLIVILAGLPLLAFLLGGLALRRLLPGRHGLRKGLVLAGVLLVVLGMGAAVVALGDLPSPPLASKKPNAGGSVSSTATDMARFLIELGNPQYLSPEAAAQMRQPQVSLSGNLSWGLGPGIQHSPQGDALWQWGQATDFQSVMIIYPDLGYGVVVLTNSDLLNSDVAIDIAHRALGGSIESIRRASHLEFNYQGPFLEE